MWYTRCMSEIKKADSFLKTVRNLEYEVIADKGSKPLDYYRNRCLNWIEKIQGLSLKASDKEWYLAQAFSVYHKLQDRTDPPGTQDTQNREIPASNLKEQDKTLKSSRGYAKMNWSGIGWSKTTTSDNLRGWYGGYKIGNRYFRGKDLSKSDYWAAKKEKK